MAVPFRLRLLVGILSQQQLQSPLRTALTDRCPRCGEGALYRSFIGLNDSCSECDLSFAAHDSGDGPAFFTIIVLGFVVAGLAVYAELAYRPAYLTHLLLWPPLMLILTIPCLRFFKSYLLAWQYKTHRLEDKDL